MDLHQAEEHPVAGHNNGRVLLFHILHTETLWTASLARLQCGEAQTLLCNAVQTALQRGCQRLAGGKVTG